MDRIAIVPPSPSRCRDDDGDEVVVTNDDVVAWNALLLPDKKTNKGEKVRSSSCA